jgi:pyridoxamine 5'-phosphate oxidase
MSISDIRRDYSGKSLSEANTPLEPFSLFGKWWADAEAAGIKDINACALATSSLDGRPSVRMVLLKGWSVTGFEFYTNYESPKSMDLLANPAAELLFWWADLGRQIRLSGKVEKVAREKSEAYFHSRPRESQLGAIASKQSKILDSKESLIMEMENLEKTYSNDTLPLPETWGGFCLKPNKVEFWQGQPNRLHDRVIYEWADSKWKKFQIYP